VVGIAIGLGVTVLSAIGPARRSTKVAPVAAMTAAAVSPTLGSWRRPALGTALVAVGLAFGARGLSETSLAQAQRLESIGIGGAFAFLGIAMLARYLAGPIIGVIGWPWGRLGGVGVRLARRNAIRDPRRTASTALALTIGMALVATTLVLGASVKTAFGGALRASINAPVVVSAGGISPIDATVSRAIAAAPGVTSAVAIESARIRTARVGGGFFGGTPSGGGQGDGGQGGGGQLDVSTGSIAAISRVVRPDFHTGGFPPNDSTIAISASTADDRHLRVGDTVTVESRDQPDPSSSPATSPPGTTTPTGHVMTISGVYERDELLGDAVVRPGVISALDSTNPPVTKLVLVTTNGDPAALAHRLARVAAGIPNSAAQTADDYVTSQTNALDIVLGIVDVLLLFAVLVAALGIANTLALAVVERTRELGLLRAAGMDRRVVRRMIRIEGVLIALFGGFLGIGFGVAFGVTVADALPVDTARLTLPAGRLVLLFLAAGLLGVVAGAIPARRAARLDVLEAVAVA
jgi:putative ABC transport system permease protein